MRIWFAVAFLLLALAPPASASGRLTLSITPGDTSNVWYRIATGKYVAKAYVSGVSGATAC